MTDATAVKVLKITPAGETSDIELSAGNTLHGLSQAIGCDRVDIVRLTTRVDM